MAVYLAVAYRWGWTNSHQYFVACSQDLAAVQARAERNWEDRDGKYGVAVFEMPEDPTAQPPKCLNYFPSSYGEQGPRENARIEAFKTLGQRVFGALAHGKTSVPDNEGRLVFLPVSVPGWLRWEGHRAASVNGLVYAPGSNLLPPSKKQHD